jgi:hypothetical protein
VTNAVVAVITYRDRRTPVQLGDRVETRIWFRKHRGRVVYIPGTSPLNGAMAFNGLTWVGVRLDEGGFVSCIVDPAQGYLRNKVVLLSRDAANISELQPDEDPHGEDSFASP